MTSESGAPGAGADKAAAAAAAQKSEAANENDGGNGSLDFVLGKALTTEELSSVKVGGWMPGTILIIPDLVGTRRPKEREQYFHLRVVGAQNLAIRNNRSLLYSRSCGGWPASEHVRGAKLHEAVFV